MSKIVVIGSVNIDIVASVETLPIVGETVITRDINYYLGGKGANQAVSASRLDGDVMLVGKIGSDSFGEQALALLKKEKLNISAVTKVTDIGTGIAFINVDEKGDNFITVFGGANDKLIVEDVSNINIKEGDFVVSTLESPQEPIIFLFKKAREVGAYTLLNAAPAILFEKELLTLVDYLIINEIELASYSKSNVTKEVDQVVKNIKKIRFGENQKVIATLGEHGLVCVVGNEVIQVPAKKVIPVDTTAAGDCFVGAFVTALSEGKNLVNALEFATIASSISVTRLGASSSLPSRDEVDKLNK